jgi:AcrR family transcriptional regulator
VLPLPARQESPRQERALRNDRRIVESAIDVLHESGWGALSPTHVARRTGLNPSTVSARFPDRAALAAGTWRAELGEVWLTHVTALIEAGDTSGVTGAELVTAFEPFMSPSPAMRAACELILVSSYESSLQRTIADTVGAQLTDWLTPQRGQVTRTDAARHAFLIAKSLGFVLEAGRLGDFDADFSLTKDALAYALAHPTSPARLPSARADFLDEPMDFATGDPAWDAILTATLDCVGELGYEAATIDTIDAAAGYSRTVIFTRYRTKQDLFIDATDRIMAKNVALSVAYQQEIEATSGDGIPDSCYLRETMRPERTRIRTIGLEQTRLAAHIEALHKPFRESLRQYEEIFAAEAPDQTVRQIRARLISDVALSTGALALAQMRSDVWQLPFDTILVPLRRGAGQHEG